jgi:hypothetical protein
LQVVELVSLLPVLAALVMAVFIIASLPVDCLFSRLELLAKL